MYVVKEGVDLQNCLWNRASPFEGLGQRLLRHLAVLLAADGVHTRVVARLLLRVAVVVIFPANSAARLSQSARVDLLDSNPSCKIASAALREHVHTEK